MTTNTTGSGGPGTLLGRRYRLEDLLSESRGARFWRGVDTVLGRSVAIHAVSSEDERAEDLLEAARTSATVADSRLLRVLDCDDEGGTAWVVNEWGDGLSLDRMLERDVLPATRAAWLVREVAESIANSHRQGECHGRLNPEAVLVTNAGAVKLIGFAVDAALAPPPETHEYGRVDATERDVIDLASLLYAALVGRWPGISHSTVPVAPRDLGGPLRPRQVRAGVPRTLDAICMRVLRKEAHEHTMPIETAHEVAAALDDFVGDPLVNAPGDVPSMYVEPTVALSRNPRDGRLVAPPGVSSRPGPAHQEPIPDLPPFEDSSERPLFASTERRRPARPGATAATGATAPAPGTPPPPSAQEEWLFGEEDDPPPPPPRRWLRWLLAAAAACVLALAMVVAFHLGDTSRTPQHPETSNSPSAGARTQRGEPIKPASVSDFDPEGNPPTENPDEVPLATDHDPTTGWRTMTYRGSSHLGDLKSGVGLLLDLGSDHEVGSVQLTFTGTPTSVSAYVAPKGTDTTPTSLSGLHRAAHLVADRPHATLRFDPPVHSRYVVIWLTNLPKVGPGHFRGQVDEVRVLS